MFRFVCGCPDVHEGHRRVEPVEDADGQRHVAQHRPAVRPVERDLGRLVPDM